MARKLRQIERVEFTIDDLSPVVARMVRVTSAGDGWINLVPITPDSEEKPTTLRFFTLLSGGGMGVTMCTWIPGNRGRRGRVNPSLGITHVTGHRIVGDLRSGGAPVPDTWVVQQDHPRRGLVLSIPSDEPHEQVLAWALRAAGVLNSPRPIGGWRADIHLPAST